MRLKIFLAIALGFVLFGSSAFAQGRVSGIVKDRKGEPLIGANVYVKGTTISTISGIDGQFNINAPDSSSVLVITFNGYQNLEVTVRDLPTANLQMKPVVSNDFTGFYGNDSYYNVTASNVLVMADDKATGLETDVYQFLLGRVPGLEIVSDGGNPWGDVDYRLRGGYSALSENAKPLFVVDGAYFDADFAISALNTDDIESVRFLKDAAGTAIYGDAGANGVVLITTRHSMGKTLAAGYSGNVSYNTCDEEEAHKNSRYKNSVSTKHNANVSGVAGPMPYRVSLGYNKINGSERHDWTDEKRGGSDRLSAAFWVGPNLLDEHLKIDFNGYFRNINERRYPDYKCSRFMSTLKADYSVHSFEDLHVNLLTSFNRNSTNKENDYTMGGFMLDGNLSYSHESEDSKQYVELKVGGVVNTLKEESTVVIKNKEETLTDKTSRNALYGQLNAALNRFYLKANARYNIYSDYNTVSSSFSIGVRPASGVVMRTGVGILGFVTGGKTDSISSFSTITYNLGLDVGGKKRVYGSADFYVNHNSKVYEWTEIVDNKEDYTKKDTISDLGDITLTNVGGEFSLGAKIVDTKKVKWRIGGHLSYNVSVTDNRGKYNKNLNEQGSNYVIGDKPLTYNVYESVFDKKDNPIPGLYIDQDDDGKVNNNDREMTDFSPLPLSVAGLNTYFEAMDVYLQIDSHASIDRFNLVENNTGSLGTGDIHNSSFLRIDNIVLGYKIRNLGMLSGRAYVAVQNPFVFTKYTGHEPEIYNGIDYGEYYNYQRPTIFSVGVKLNVNIKD